MGIRLLAGRGFTDDDRRGAPNVAVINRSLADLAFPDGAPVGRRITGRRATWEIVGVVDDVRHFGLDAPSKPQVYLPFQQAPFRFLTLVVRSEVAGRTLLSSVRETIRSLDPQLPVPEVRPLENVVAGSIAAPRFRAGIFLGVGGLALLLAVTGVAGLLTYSVHQRRREIGIRMALGSSSAGIGRLVMAYAARLTVLGVVFGGASSLAAGRLLGTFLFEVSEYDPAVALQSVLVLSLTALAGACLPMRRATGVDPVSTLREE